MCNVFQCALYSQNDMQADALVTASDDAGDFIKTEVRLGMDIISESLLTMYRLTESYSC
jgi:hypothetical protein